MRKLSHPAIRSLSLVTIAFRARIILGSIAALAFALTALRAEACSICRCGDPTFNALGKDVTSEPGFRFAFDIDRFSKTQGPPEEQDSIVEDRYTAVGAYTLGSRALLVARVPFAQRTLDERVGDEIEHSEGSGLGDPELSAQIRLWSSPLDGDLGRRLSFSATVGVKTSWGENDIEKDGERLDEHVQPGTGSTDPFFGVSGYYLLNTKSSLFASVQRRLPGANDFGYQYGDISLLNFAYERKLTTNLDSVLELNYRHAGRDQIDGSGDLDPNTGGSILYLTPRVLVNVGGVVVRFAAQIPVSESLYGVQNEKPVYNIGFTRSFGK
jgi:hypothetical protein